MLRTNTQTTRDLIRGLTGLSDKSFDFLLSADLEDHPLREFVSFATTGSDGRALDTGSPLISSGARPNDSDSGSLEYFIEELKNLNKEGFSTQGEEARRGSWRRMGQALEDLRKLFDSANAIRTTDEIFFRLFNIDSSTTEDEYARIAKDWDRNWSSSVLAGAACLCRFALGAMLGWLNIPTTSSLPRSVVAQLAVVFQTTVSNQATLRHQWCSVPFCTSLLLEGKGILPFSLIGLGNWPLSRVQTEEDARAAEEAFVWACALGHSVSHGQLLFRVAPYSWTRHRIQEKTAVITLFEQTLSRVQEQTGRGYGVTQILWDEFAQYFDPLRVGKQTHNQYTPYEQAQIAELHAKGSRHDPEEIATTFPEHTVLSMLSQINRAASLGGSQAEDT